MSETALSPADLKKLKVTDLRRELTNRDLSSKGTKPELIQRLTEFFDAVAAAAVEKDLLEGGDDEPKEKAGSGNAAELEELAAIKDDKAATESAEVIEDTTGNEKSISSINSQPSKDVDTAQTKKPNVVLSNQDKKLNRAERFGVTPSATVDGKLEERAKKFGMKTGDGKLGERAKRFGLKATDLAGESRLRQRQQRFGIATKPLPAEPTGGNPYKLDNRDKVKKRKERFGLISSGPVNTENDAKKKKRAERFGL